MRALALGAALAASALALPGCVVPANTVQVDVDSIGIEYAPSRLRRVLDERGYQPVEFKHPTSNAMTYLLRDARIMEWRFRAPTSGSVVFVRLDRQTAQWRLWTPKPAPGAEAEMARLKRALATEYGADRVQ